MKEHLHGGPPENVDVEGLKKEVEELRQHNRELESQVAQLKTAVSFPPWQAWLCPVIFLAFFLPFSSPSTSRTLK